MTPTIQQIRYRKIVRPMRTRFVTSLGSKSVATSVLVTVTLSDGSVGVGEAPTSFVMPHETVAAIEAICAEARDAARRAVPIGEYRGLLEALGARHGDFHMTLAGLEVALFRAFLASVGKNEWRHWGGRQSEIRTDITIPFLPQRALLEQWLAASMRAGFGTYKVKVSGNVQADLPFVQTVRDQLAAGDRPYVLRLDGNQGYTVKTYLQMLGRLEKAGIGIELFEQPLKRDDYRGLAAIAGRSPVPVILDETVFTAADARRVIDNRLGDGINIKIAKSGIAGAAAIMKLARRSGLKLMIGCMTETMVGLSAGIRLAAGSGAFDYIDLDSIHLLAHKRQYGDVRLYEDRYFVGE